MRRSTLFVQVGVLARRSVVRTLRQPAMVVPSLVFPLMLLAINSSGRSPASSTAGALTMPAIAAAALANTRAETALMPATSATEAIIATSRAPT